MPDCCAVAWTLRAVDPQHPCLSACRNIAANNFSGAIPASWATLPELSKVVAQPGNPQLCPLPPDGSPAMLQVCSDGPLCLPSDLNISICATTAGAAGATGDDGGSSFPVAAVAVPVAVVVAAAVVGAALWWRRRHRNAPDSGSAKPLTQQGNTKDLPWLEDAHPPPNLASPLLCMWELPMPPCEQHTGLGLG